MLLLIINISIRIFLAGAPFAVGFSWALGVWVGVEICLNRNKACGLRNMASGVGDGVGASGFRSRGV